MTLLVPLITLIFNKDKRSGYLVCLILIIINILVNMESTRYYDLKMGIMHVNNYRLLEAIIAKPWTKL